MREESEMSDQALQKFRKDHEPKKPLYKHKQAIIELKNEGYSLSQITLYLKDYLEIKTNVSAVWRLLQDMEVVHTLNHKVAPKEPENQAAPTKELTKNEAAKNAAAFFINQNIVEEEK